MPYQMQKRHALPGDMTAPTMITHGKKGLNLRPFGEAGSVQSKLQRTESREKVGLLFRSLGLTPRHRANVRLHSSKRGVIRTHHAFVLRLFVPVNVDEVVRIRVFCVEARIMQMKFPARAAVLLYA